MIEYVCCPLCGKNNTNPDKYESKTIGSDIVKLGHVKCECGMRYVSPRLNADGLNIIYSSLYKTDTISGLYNVEKSVSIQKYKTFQKYLIQVLPDGGKVLDVGCGVGNFIETINECGNYKIEGIEYSSYAAEIAKKKGLNVINGELIEKAYESNSFDCVVMLDVLEHVHNPRAILHEINKILKPGGFLLLSVPNYRYLKIIADNVIAKLINSKASLHPEEHLQNFTPVTLEKILFSEKFTVNKWGCAKPLHIGSWKRKLIKSILYFPVVALYKVGYNIGGIYAICRKNEE